MEDSEIIKLYFERSEQAISETSLKYGAYCRSIAMNVLSSPLDAEEVVQDTWMGAWNSIPPNRPQRLSTYLGKIARRLSLKKYRDGTRLKRGGCGADAVFEELEDCIPAPTDPEKEACLFELKKVLDDFIGSLKDDDQDMFVLRYWYFEPVERIAADLGCSVSRVKTSLYRNRKKLMQHLQKEGMYER